MKQLHSYFIALWSCVLLMAGACATSSPEAGGQTATSTSPGSNYTTAFPSKDVSKDLQRIQKSVKRISSTAIYVTYFFEDRLLTPDELKHIDLDDVSSRKMTNTESTAGTAVSTFSNSLRIALLTNAHVVSFPDTLISYRDQEGISPNTYVGSIKIKKSQNYLIYDLPNVGSFDVIASDESADLALLRVSQNNFPELSAPSLPVRPGNARDLRAGSFVYIMGYPKGYSMITRGIVSEANRNEEGDFLTDALFNRGISGGLMLASRDNFNSLEWVGMTNSAVGQSSRYLVPDPVKSYQYRSFDAYTDSIYVEEKVQITYGITQAIPINRIRSFLRDHADKLRRMGFSPNL